MDEYLDKLSVELLRIYCKRPYNLSQLEAKTELNERALCSTIALLRKRNYLIIEPNYALLHPSEIKSLGDSIAWDTPLRITKEGMAALEKAEFGEKKARLDEKRYKVNQIRDWATFVVSLATLIATIISLLRQ